MPKTLAFSEGLPGAGQSQMDAIRLKRGLAPY